MSRIFVRVVLVAVSASLCALVLPFGGTGQAQAKRQAKKQIVSTACKIAYLPFVTGRSWTYQYAIPPNAKDAPGALRAKIPDTFTIVVKAIETTNGSTAITLEESYRKVNRETVLHCDAKGLRVPLESFFFAGELPGAIGMATDKLVSNGDTYPAAHKLTKGNSLFVEIRGPVARESAEGTQAKLSTANLEIERSITVGSSENVEVEHGIHKAIAVEVALAGRSALQASPDKKLSLPDGNAMLWFSPGIGLVRAYNRLGQGWELRDFKDADGNDIE